MKGKLIKRGEGDYKLFVNDTPFGQSKESPYNKLSLKNCEAIANGYDLDELVKNMGKEFYVGGNYDFENGVKEGFLKALKILGDKKFSEDDVISMIEKSRETGLTAEYIILTNQQTEWDVEIVTEPYVKYVSRSLHTVYPPLDIQNKLDKDGCLILKRI